ncbi:uncharacterized protein VTP21DRAFT_2152 [Calcarisporiella thermophila]|uniref:uncharacterized protein n=1 Tax=Calcarisporiella thermophila TaxID=911321 RepID=UPI003742F56C
MAEDQQHDSANASAQDIEKLKTQLDVSVGLARSLVSSWLPPEDDPVEEEVVVEEKGRPARLGLGAKFITHNEATRHLASGTFESKLKRKFEKKGKPSEDAVKRPKQETPEEDVESKANMVGRTNTKKGGDFLSAYLGERQAKKKKKKSSA